MSQPPKPTSPAAKVMTLNIDSPSVGKSVRAIAMLPIHAQHTPVVYLLHGRGGGPEFWTDNFHLPTLVAHDHMALVAVTGENGFYTDSLAGGADWEASLLHDQIPAVERQLGIGGERKTRVIVGFSMGGFGAMKIAMKYPDKFGGVYTIAGSFGSGQSDDEPLKIEIFGPLGSAQRQHNDPFSLAPLVPHKLRPAVGFDCGLSDELIDPNRKFDALLTHLNWRHIYHEYPGFHDRTYVEARLPEMLAFARHTFGLPAIS